LARTTIKILYVSCSNGGWDGCEKEVGFNGIQDQTKRNGAAYPGNLKQFLDDITKSLNAKFSDAPIKKQILGDIEDMEGSIGAAIDIFGIQNVCRKWKGGQFDTRFNRAVFDIQISSLAVPAIKKWALANKATFKGAFVNLCRDDREFLASLETTTKSKEAVNKRFVTWFKKIRRVSHLDVNPPFELGREN